MRKNICKFKTFVLCVLPCVFVVLTGCTGYDPFYTGYFSGGCSPIEAFIGACFWSGGDMTIEIPDEYEGKKVTVLGGYSGIGYPDPFRIVLEKEGIDGCSGTAEEGDAYETLVFTVKIGRNIKEVQYAEGELYWGTGIEEDGEWHFDVVYKVAYRFEADSRNKAYYSENGRLYRRKDHMLLPFFYE